MSPVRAACWGALVGVLAVAACAEPALDSADPCLEGGSVSWEDWGRSFFVTYCSACHAAASPNRYGAPEALTFDTEAEVRALRDTIERVVLEEESMPVGGGVRPEDLEDLARFLACLP